MHVILYVIQGLMIRYMYREKMMVNIYDFRENRNVTWTIWSSAKLTWTNTVILVR